MTSTCKQLEKTLGGKWKYGNPGCWYCDDQIRMIVRCSAGTDEFDHQVAPPQFWLYGDGSPRRAEKYIQQKEIKIDWKKLSIS